MQKKRVLFTTCLRFGDTLHVLPIASWYAREHGVKVDWALERAYGDTACMEVLRAQPFIGEIRRFSYSLVKHPSWPAGCHGAFRPTHIVGPRLEYYGEYEKVFDFGFSKDQFELGRMPWFTEHFAEEYGMGIDRGFRLEYGEPDATYSGQVVKIDKYYQPVLGDIQGIPLEESNGVIQNLRYAAGAKDVITTRTGAAVMLSLARIPFKIRFLDDDWEYYYRFAHSGMTGGLTRI